MVEVETQSDLRDYYRETADYYMREGPAGFKTDPYCDSSDGDIYDDNIYLSSESGQPGHWARVGMRLRLVLDAFGPLAIYDIAEGKTSLDEWIQVFGGLRREALEKM